MEVSINWTKPLLIFWNNSQSYFIWIHCISPKPKGSPSNVLVSNSNQLMVLANTGQLIWPANGTHCHPYSNSDTSFEFGHKARNWDTSLEFSHKAENWDASLKFRHNIQNSGASLEFRHKTSYRSEEGIDCNSHTSNLTRVRFYVDTVRPKWSMPAVTIPKIDKILQFKVCW